jgi:hypothetical protein
VRTRYILPETDLEKCFGVGLVWGVMDLVGELVRLRGEVCGHLEVNLYSVCALLGWIMCELTSEFVP